MKMQNLAYTATDPILLVDTWESGGEIDEFILHANGVCGMIVRLNDMSGGHHMDTNFWTQWEQAKNLSVRIPYFVYNPWVSGQKNYDWLVSHIPSECGAVMVDVEVRYTGYPAVTYASEINKFKDLLGAKYNYMIYTGQGYLDLLSVWPVADYWWAAYPLAFYQYETLTWDALRDRLETMPRPANESKVPGTLKMWQFTGDRIILPGCDKRMDVNVYYGSLDELKTWVNEKTDLPSGDVLLSEHQYFVGAVERQYETSTPHGKAIYNLTEIETAQIEKCFVSPQVQSRTYVPTFLEDFSLDIAVNCGGWTSPPLLPTGYNASEGQPYGPTGQEETVYINTLNEFSLTKPSIIWNAFSFQNRLVQDGVIPVINKAITDIRARTAIGYNQNQSKLFLFTCDGGDQYSTEGLNFQEVAAILLRFGCYQAYMLDGGGSTAKVISDAGIATVIGTTSGEDFVVNYLANLRRVINVFGVVMKSGVTPPTGDKMYKVLISVKERPIASMYSTGGGVVNAGYQFDSMVTVVGNNVFKPADYGVTFVQLPSGNWLPMIYKGVEYVTKTETPPPPPTGDEFVSATLTRSDGTTKDFDLIPKV